MSTLMKKSLRPGKRRPVLDLDPILAKLAPRRKAMRLENNGTLQSTEAKEGPQSLAFFKKGRAVVPPALATQQTASKEERAVKEKENVEPMMERYLGKHHLVAHGVSSEEQSCREPVVEPDSTEDVTTRDSKTMRCVPLKNPVQEHSERTLGCFKSTSMTVKTVANYPEYLNQRMVNAKRHCVMCGYERRVPCSRRSPYHDKSLCTTCRGTVWLFTENHVKIKYCSSCRDFCPWIAFGDDLTAKNCAQCQERIGERKTARQQKEESEDGSSVMEGLPASTDDDRWNERTKSMDRSSRFQHLSSHNSANDPVSAVQKSSMEGSQRLRSTVACSESMTKAYSDEKNDDAAPGNSTAMRCVPLKDEQVVKMLEGLTVNERDIVPPRKLFFNYPQFLQEAVHNGKRHCAMCGELRLVIRSSRTESKDPFIPLRSKNLCSACAANTWLVVEKDLKVKCCSSCKVFRPLSMFVVHKKVGRTCKLCRHRNKSVRASRRTDMETHGDFVGNVTHDSDTDGPNGRARLENETRDKGQHDSESASLLSPIDPTALKPARSFSVSVAEEGPTIQNETNLNVKVAETNEREDESEGLAQCKRYAHDGPDSCLETVSNNTSVSGPHFSVGNVMEVLLPADDDFSSTTHELSTRRRLAANLESREIVSDAAVSEKGSVPKDHSDSERCIVRSASRGSDKSRQEEYVADVQARSAAQSLALGRQADNKSESRPMSNEEHKTHQLENGQPASNPLTEVANDEPRSCVSVTADSPNSSVTIERVQASGAKWKQVRVTTNAAQEVIGRNGKVFSKLEARSMVAKLVNGKIPNRFGWGHGQGMSVGTYRSRGIFRNSATMGTLEVETFPVPKRSIGHIIGKKAATIKELMQLSGCVIDVNRDISQGHDCEILIRGTRPGIEMTKAILREIVEMWRDHSDQTGGRQHGSYRVNAHQQNRFSQAPPMQERQHRQPPAPLVQYGYQYSALKGQQTQSNGRLKMPRSQSATVVGQVCQRQQPPVPLVQCGYQRSAPKHKRPQLYGRQGMPPTRSLSFGQQPPPTRAPKQAPIAGPWKAATTADGQTYYYNEATWKTQWERPELTTSSWKSATTADGQTYYYNEETREIQWENPADM